MSTLVKLQKRLDELGKDKLKAQLLNKLVSSQEWNSIINEGFFGELVNDSIKQLANSDKENKEKILATLTGVSVLQKYLQTITINSEAADSNIRETELAITELLQEN